MTAEHEFVPPYHCTCGWWTDETDTVIGAAFEAHVRESTAHPTPARQAPAEES